MEQNGSASPTQGGNIFLGTRILCCHFFSSIQKTTCIWRPAVAACTVGIIPRRVERAHMFWLWCSGIRDGTAALDGLLVSFLPLKWIIRGRTSDESANQKNHSLFWFFSWYALLIYGTRCSIPFSCYPNIKHFNWSKFFTFPGQIGYYEWWVVAGGRGSSEGKGDAAAPFFQIYFITYFNSYTLPISSNFMSSFRRIRKLLLL